MATCKEFPKCGCKDKCVRTTIKAVATEIYKALADRTLEIAKKEVGVAEEKENWGKRVAEYLKEAQVKTPAPWCAAFCNWVAKRAATDLGIDSPLEKVPLQAYVQSYFDYFNKQGKVVPAAKAKPGDLIVLWYPSLKRYGHIGIVEKVDVKKGIAYTIEGNTNAAGSREGEQVAAKQRPITANVKFLRWIGDV